MKANELMIGDWLRTSRGIAKVIAVDKIGLTFKIDGGDFDIDWDDEEEWFDAIPLTPKILEKNGFVRSKVFVEWKYENDNVYMIYKPFPYLKIQMDDCIVAFPCEYIHELQHALCLCGIEKEIEL